MNKSHDDIIEALLRQEFEGPIADGGFSERVMQHLPSRRRRIAWPMWAGLLIGAVACWACLISVPLLRSGWSDWLGGDLSMAAIGMLMMMTVMSLMALGWGLIESSSR